MDLNCRTIRVAIHNDSHRFEFKWRRSWCHVGMQMILVIYGTPRTMFNVQGILQQGRIDSNAIIQLKSNSN